MQLSKLVILFLFFFLIQSASVGMPSEFEPYRFVNSGEPWTSTDESVVLLLLKRIGHIEPTLIKTAAHDELINFVRRTELPSSINEIGGEIKCLAAAENGQIFLGDTFFSLPDERQMHTLIHELVHVADAGGLLAYSPDWILKACPIRKEQYFAGIVPEPVPFSPDWFLKEKAEIKYQASLLKQNNLADVLADYVSDKLQNPNPESRSNDPFLQRLIKPDLTDQVFLSTFRAGQVFLRQNNLQAAKAKFEQASILFPCAPMPQVKIAFGEFKDKNYAGALEAATRAEKLFKNLNVPMSEIPYFQVLQIQAALLIKLEHDYIKASKIIKELMVTSPKDSWTLSLAKICDQNLSKEQKSQVHWMMEPYEVPNAAN